MSHQHPNPALHLSTPSKLHPRLTNTPTPSRDRMHSWVQAGPEGAYLQHRAWLTYIRHARYAIRPSLTSPNPRDLPPLMHGWSIDSSVILSISCCFLRIRTRGGLFVYLFLRLSIHLFIATIHQFSIWIWGLAIQVLSIYHAIYLAGYLIYHLL